MTAAPYLGQHKSHSSRDGGGRFGFPKRAIVINDGTRYPRDHLVVTCEVGVKKKTRLTRVAHCVCVRHCRPKPYAPSRPITRTQQTYGNRAGGRTSVAAYCSHVVCRVHDLNGNETSESRWAFEPRECVVVSAGSISVKMIFHPAAAAVA